MPSTFSVENLADSGAGSLRQAVLDANNHPGPDSIRFSPAVRGTIHLTGGDLTITDDLTIDGPGAKRLTLSGENQSRIFRLDNAGGAVIDVAISRLTIANGLADQVDVVTPLGLPFTGGSAILVAENQLRLSHVVFRDNVARGFVASGAVVGFSGADITATHSTFVNNVATAQFLGVGGAIGVDANSTVAVSHSHFAGNRAMASLGETVFPEGNGSGGAIVAAGGSLLTVSNSLFTDNSVHGGDGVSGQAGGSALGGAVAASDLSVFLVEAGGSTLNVHRSTFIGNVAEGGEGGAAAPGGLAWGGAVHPSLRTVATVTDSVFVANRARGGRGGDGGPGQTGGTGGQAASGALDGVGTSLTVARTLFLGNEAVGGAGGMGGAGAHGGVGGVGSGGATRFLGGLSADPSGNITGAIASSLFLHNRAIGGAGGQGGDGGQGGRGGDAFGGAIDAFVLTDLTLTNSLLKGNRAVGGQGGNGQGSGQGGNGGDGLGGGLSVVDGTASATMRRTIITKNSAAGGGEGLGGTPGIGIGGGIFNLSHIDIDVRSLIFANDADAHEDCFGC